MKKILYFGLCICAVLAMCFCVPIFSSVNAEETETTISIDNEEKFNELFKSNIESGQKFVLTDDIVLQNEVTTFENRNIQDIEFDGNGHIIVTSYPLFNKIGENTTIKNFSVIATKNFEYSVTTSSIRNFGLVACEINGGYVYNVCASCELISKKAPNEEKLNNTYGVLNLSFNGHTTIGGMFGSIKSTVVQDCFTQTALNVTQQDANASSTVVGGFVGYVENSVITNSYAVPTYTELISIEYNDTTPLFIIGGFAGQLGVGACCKNIFVGGYLPSVDTQNNRYVGKIFGQIDESITNSENDLKISRCYSYNQTSASTIDFCGIKSNTSVIDVLSITEQTLSSMSTFANGAKIGENYIWDMSWEWDIDQTWCQKNGVTFEEEAYGSWSVAEKWKNQSYTFPVLQIFQSFSVSINESNNDVGVTVSLVDENGDLLSDEDFVYGTTVYINIKITEDYIPYKVIDSLKFNNVSLNLKESIYGKQEANVPIVISQGTSGSYYVSTENISYYLVVKSQNNSMGTVRYTGATSTISENEKKLIVLDSNLSFTANPEVSYAFEKWVWINENGQEACDVCTGVVSENEDDNQKAQQTMKILFGNSNTTDNNYVHLLLDFEDESLVANNSIPYKLEDNKIIFTIQANFSPDIQKLKVYVNAPSDACQVYISENECEGIANDGMVFSQNVTAGTYVKVRVDLSEEYKFLGWSSLTDEYNIKDLIDKKNSDITSTEIYVKIQEPITLYAQVEKIEENKTDLTWLWITLGGLGGAGLITLIVVLAVRKKKTESFVRYY